jgi:hypothetical protein
VFTQYIVLAVGVAVSVNELGLYLEPRWGQHRRQLVEVTLTASMSVMLFGGAMQLARARQESGRHDRLAAWKWVSAHAPPQSTVLTGDVFDGGLWLESFGQVHPALGWPPEFVAEAQTWNERAEIFRFVKAPRSTCSTGSCPSVQSFAKLMQHYCVTYAIAEDIDVTDDQLGAQFLMRSEGARSSGLMSARARFGAMEALEVTSIDVDSCPPERLYPSR